MPACATSAARFSAEGPVALLDAPASAYPVPFDEREGPLWDALREVMDPEIPVISL